MNERLRIKTDLKLESNHRAKQLEVKRELTLKYLMRLKRAGSSQWIATIVNSVPVGRKVVDEIIKMHSLESVVRKRTPNRNQRRRR